MRTLPIGLVSLAIIGGALTVIACSAPPAAIDQGGQDDTEDPSTQTPGATKKATTPSDPSAPTTPTPPTVDPDAGTGVDGSVVTPPPATQQDCSATTTQDACYQCCDTSSGGGYKVADDAWKQCICQMPGVCAQACAGTVCSAAGSDPDQQCGSCLDSQKASQCDQVADQACQGSAACQAADQCAQTNNCDGKQQ